MTETKITPEFIRTLKHGKRFAALTAYDFPMARWLDEAGVPMLLVGDSLGMVVLGHPDTTHVTLADMLHHTRAVARARPRALVGSDLPYRTYETPAEALANARQLLAAGAEYVKLEGGQEILPQIRELRAVGIPVCGHLGMLPQHILEEGKYRIKGRVDAEHQRLLADARSLSEAGVFAIVLELVTPPVAEEITATIDIPTIGIGSGSECDGQILVTSDLIGAFPWFTPRFVTPRAQVVQSARTAVEGWMSSLNNRQ